MGRLKLLAKLCEAEESMLLITTDIETASNDNGRKELQGNQPDTVSVSGCQQGFNVIVTYGATLSWMQEEEC